MNIKRDMSSQKELPTVLELSKLLKNLSNILYVAWRKELRERILNLELEGYISKDHINVPSSVWRLPNDNIRYALGKLKTELDNLGYDYEFKFDEVDEVNWVMWYSLVLPEDEDKDDEVSDDKEENRENREKDDVDSDNKFKEISL